MTEHLLELFADEVQCEQYMIELGRLAPQLAGAVGRPQLPDAVERALTAVELADVLVVATPVYRGSYTGLFKHFFDFIHQDALIDKPVLLAATGGSERHTLILRVALAVQCALPFLELAPRSAFDDRSLDVPACVHATAA